MRPIVIAVFTILSASLATSVAVASAQTDAANGWRETVNEHQSPIRNAGFRTDAEDAGTSLPQATVSSCTPTTTALEFDGGYRVSMCYRTPDGQVGQAKAGVWASGQSGILWFFDRGNAEVLVKVLNGCSNNGHRWAFVAPVTTLEFNLWITGPNGRRWTHSNEQGRTAATKSDIRAFRCSDETGGDNGDDDDDGGGDGAPDLVVQSPSVSDTSPVTDQSISFRATVRNVGDGAASSTTIRYYSSSNSTISDSDHYISSDVVAALPASGTSLKTIQLVYSRPGTSYLGACVDSVSGESDTNNNCSTGVRVVISAPSLTGTWTGSATSTLTSVVGSVRATVIQVGSSLSGTWSVNYPSVGTNSGTLSGTVTGSAVSVTLYPADPTSCLQAVTATLRGSSMRGTWSTVNCTVSDSGSISLNKGN